MDAIWNKVLKCLINDTVPHYRRFAGKMRADDGHRKMAAAAVAGVSGMQRGVVLQFEQHRFQDGQALTNFVGERAQAGSVLRKGLTLTL